MDTKKWWASRTLWVNTLVAVGLIVQAVTGKNWLDAELQAAIIIVANVVLRLITNQGLSI